MFNSSVHTANQQLVAKPQQGCRSVRMFPSLSLLAKLLSNKSLLSAFCLSLAALSGLPQAAQAYTVQAIIGAGFGGANAISENGNVAGVGTHGTTTKGFRYIASTSTVNFIGANTTPWGINDSGVVCGNASGLSAFPFEGFIYPNTTLGIQRMGDGFIEARAINNDGYVTGRRCMTYNNVGGVYTAPTEAYVFNVATWGVSNLSRPTFFVSRGAEGWAINASENVAGVCDTYLGPMMEDAPPVDSNVHATLWTSSGYSFRNGRTNSSSVQDPGIAYGINDSDATVGESGGYAMYWASSTATVLGQLGGNFTAAKDINNSGTIVGNAYSSGSSIHGWVCTTSSTTPVDLDTLISNTNIDGDPTNGPDIIIYEANAINDDGKIAAKGFYRDGTNPAGIYPLILTP